MIKLFRHIRRSLINQNQMGKYFKYAIGEILLVVIGILIALQINNWNQNRIESKLEQGYYCRILEDFKLTQNLIDTSKQDVRKQIDYGKQIIIDLHKNTKSKEEILNNWLKFIRLEKFVPNNTSYQDAVSSGNLNLFKDEEIKKSLAIYDANLENILTQINQNRDQVVQRSFNVNPVDFGVQNFDYLKKSLGSEIFALLPDKDWVHNPESEIFKNFQNDMVLNIALLERHIQHINRIADEMKKPAELLDNKCNSND